MNVVFIAPPAAGKGTQATLLRDYYNFYHISTGDVLREIAETNTPLGCEIKALIDNGKLVSDELMAKLLKEKIGSLGNVEGIIFDGFPRTLEQAHMLDEILNEVGMKVNKVIYFDIDKDTAMKRALGRVTCKDCGEIYNTYFDTFLKEDECSKCGGKLEKRMEENHKPVKIGSYRENKCPKNYFKFFDSIKIKKKYKIVFDLANGSMCFLNDYLKKRFPDAIMINNEPNGFNINDECGALYPELARKIMIDNDYDIAVSFDGDGDRAIIILKNGKILNGDLLLYFFATELKMKNKLKNNTVIYSLIANRGITNVLEGNNIKVKFVNVGDENISSEIKNGVASLGGEKSGHIIFNKKYNYSCGLTTILKFLSMLNEKAIINLNCIKEYYEVSKNYKEIRMINKLENKLKAIVTSGNVIVRRSGTENLFRVILMSPNKCEIIDGLNFLENLIIAKN